jgi:hypothetical protein
MSTSHLRHSIPSHAPFGSVEATRSTSKPKHASINYAAESAEIRHYFADLLLSQQKTATMFPLLSTSCSAAARLYEEDGSVAHYKTAEPFVVNNSCVVDSAHDEGQQGRVYQEHLTRENLSIEFCPRNFGGICP